MVFNVIQRTGSDWQIPSPPCCNDAGQDATPQGEVDSLPMETGEKEVILDGFLFCLSWGNEVGQLISPGFI